MRDYARIVTKICETPWLITPQALNVILQIVDSRLGGREVSENNLRAYFQTNGRDPAQEENYVRGSVGVLSLMGPIFGKANLLTEMSGATSLEIFRSDFRQMLDDDRIHSVLLRIDSPGGTSDLVTEVGDEIREANDFKPVYAVADTVAGSAAYWLMSQAKQAYCTPSGSVGSIGVYTVHEDRSAADTREGLRFTYISAGEYKTEGNPHEPLSAEGREYRQEIVDELYEEFVEAVAVGRDVSRADVREHFGGGRMYTASKALECGMIDGVVPYDTLINHLDNQADRNVTVHFGNQAVPAVIRGNRVIPRMESKEWEHSEPGSGNPPIPRTDEDGSDDIAIREGWRRETPPIAYELEGIEQPGKPIAKGEEIVNEEEYAELTKMLNLKQGENVLGAVQSLIEEITPLREAISMSSQEARFEKEFPQVWREHQEMKLRSRQNDATSFAQSVNAVLRQDGEEQVKTNYGLSSFAMSQIASVHMKFAEGTATVKDFEEAVQTIMHGGILQYGEVGSSIAAPDPPPIEIGTPAGIANARKMFAGYVAEIQKQDGMNYSDALSEAARQHPELAAAWRQAAPA